MKTGQFRAATPADMLMRSTCVRYDDKATYPRWETFLQEIFLGRQTLIDYIHRAIGYTLTAEISEQCFFMLHGTGANGKSVLLSALLSLMGEYGQSIPSSALKEMKSTGSASPEIARLINVRFVKSVEMKEHTRLNTEKIKYLTGGDRIVARGLYKDYVELDPTHKLWIAVNHKPIIEDNSPAIWRRVHLIPFEAHFVEPENAHEGNLIRDPNLYRTLQNELSGILNWAIQGCSLWQQQGLDPPAEVLKATSEYRKESDQVSRFLDSDDIEKAAGGSVNATELYDAYKRWCEERRRGTAYRDRLWETGG